MTGDVGSSENFIVGEGILKNVSTPNMRILPTSIPTFFCCCVFYICSVVQVTISGVVKVVSSEGEGGGARNKNKCLFLLYIDANSIHNSKTHSGDKSDSLQFTHKDLLAINEIAHEPDVFKLVVNSICPSIYGNEVEHTALSLSRSLSLSFHVHIYIATRLSSWLLLLLSSVGGRKTVETRTNLQCVATPMSS